ncbi:MAG: hypothetical protein Q8O91_03550 [Candidatus Aminicenantes bacterium]|nr:hypothetical protein [Candidatus Aminicenantes bacterium]
MAVVELATRQHRRFTDTGGLTKPSGEFGETSAFSPDDKQIAYGWQGRDRVCELRVVGFDGTNPRIVLRDANVAWFRPHDWAKDGKRILIQIMRKDKPIQIGMVSATDGTIRVIRELQAKGEDLGMALSADGGTIAYSVSPDPASSKRDVFLMKTDGSGHEALVSHPADDYLLGWAPDGRQVVFASDRTGSYGIWNVEVSNGRALGTPQLIKGDLNKVDPVRLTANGTLYYILFSNLTDVYTAPIDPETGKIIGGPAPVKVRYAGANAAPDWSRDGTRLAYRTKRGAESGPAVSALISVLDLKSGEEQQIAPRLDSIGNIDGPIWAPDGQSVLIIGNRGEERGIYKVEIPSGVTSPLVVFPPYQYTLFAVWSPDAKSIFYPQGNPTHILRRDLETGRDTELAKMDGPAGIPRITLSPDGKWLAFTSLDVLKEPQRLMIVAAAGSPAREIYRTQTGEYLHWIQWTPDGRFLWFRRYVPPADAKTKPMITYWRVSADGQNLRQLELALPGGGDICIHPDGRQIAFTSGQGKIELWALENFLPPNKK